MGQTFKYTFLSLIRNGGVLVWALAFPIVLATMFYAMFANLDYDAFGRDIGLIVVDDEAWQARDNEPLRRTLDALTETGSSSGGDGALIAMRTAPDEKRALEELYAGDAVAALLVSDSEPELLMKRDPADSMIGVKQSVVQTVLESTEAIDTTATNAIEQRLRGTADMSKLSGENFVNDLESVLSSTIGADYSQRISITENAPDENARYYYALLGLAALFAANLGLVAMNELLPGTGAVGARRSISALQHRSQIAGSLLAAWLLAFLCLLIGFLYMDVVLRVGFGHRELACVGVLALGSALATALGAVFGALPKLPTAAKAGILTGVACVGALFAGLYGTACMELADTVASLAPWSVYINPAQGISQAFFSLYAYDSMTPYGFAMLGLAALTLVLTGIAYLLYRRQRYVSV